MTLASDGQAALEKLHSEKVDVILCDIMMPRMDGLELCKAVREDPDLKHIPIVLLTARASSDDVIDGLSSGASDYIAKPYRAAELRLRLHNLAGRRPVEIPRSNPLESADEKLIQRVIEVIDDNLSNPALTIDFVADAVGMSRRQLSRRLAEISGETIASLVRRTRMERASEMFAGPHRYCVGSSVCCGVQIAISLHASL